MNETFESTGLRDSLVTIRGRSVWQWLLLAVLAQLAVRALAGGVALLIQPDGSLVGLQTAALAGSPFDDYRLPGLVLFTAFGVGPVLAAGGIYANRWWGWLAGLGVGVAFLGWLVVESRLGFVRPTFTANTVTAVAIVALAVHPSVRGGSENGVA